MLTKAFYAVVNFLLAISAPPKPPEWIYGLIEVFGNRQHFGAWRPTTQLGEPAIEVLAFSEEKTEVRVYSARAVFGLQEMTEGEARRAFVPKGYICDLYRESRVLAGHCVCGNTQADHEKKAQENAKRALVESVNRKIKETIDPESYPIYVLTWAGDKLSAVRRQTYDGGSGLSRTARVAFEEWAQLVAAGLPILPWDEASKTWARDADGDALETLAPDGGEDIPI